MPKFEFNLEAVLQQRTWVEREHQRQLAVVLARLAELEGELQRLDQMVKGSTAELKEGRLTGPIDLAFLAAHRRFVLATERKAREIMQRMSLVTRQIEEARRLLVEASRARKVVEKLRERKLAEWKTGLMESEQEEMDDISTKLTTQVWQEQQRAESQSAEFA